MIRIAKPVRILLTSAMSDKKGKMRDTAIHSHKAMTRLDGGCASFLPNDGCCMNAVERMEGGKGG